MNRKLIHELVDLVLDVNEAGDYATFELPSSYINTAHVNHMKGGHDKSREYDHWELLFNNDDLKREIKYFRNRLAELKNAPSGGNPSQGQN